MIPIDALAHISHWSHAILYLIPVAAVLVAIVLSGRADASRRQEAEDPKGETADGLDAGGWRSDG